LGYFTRAPPPQAPKPTPEEDNDADPSGAQRGEPKLSCGLLEAVVQFTARQDPIPLERNTQPRARIGYRQT
jgi:hypothetical protein